MVFFMSKKGLNIRKAQFTGPFPINMFPDLRIPGTNLIAILKTGQARYPN